MYEYEYFRVLTKWELYKSRIEVYRSIVILFDAEDIHGFFGIGCSLQPNLKFWDFCFLFCIPGSYTNHFGKILNGYSWNPHPLPVLLLPHMRNFQFFGLFFVTKMSMLLKLIWLVSRFFFAILTGERDWTIKSKSFCPTAIDKIL